MASMTLRDATELVSLGDHDRPFSESTAIWHGANNPERRPLRELTRVTGGLCQGILSLMGQVPPLVLRGAGSRHR